MWDHCHDDGHALDSLCSSCNTREGKALPVQILRLEVGT
ncbi:endonuclease domain-containing protein [Streptomyces sp. NPDC058613]